MLVSAKEHRDGVYIRDVRGDNQGGHRKARFAFKPHLAKDRADEAVGEIIHNAVLAKQILHCKRGLGGVSFGCGLGLQCCAIFFK